MNAVVLRSALALLLGLLVVAPAAVAATPRETIQAILRDCEDDGALAGNYRASELRDARRNIGTDLDQYSDCRDVLSAAELRAGAGAGGGGGGGSESSGGAGGGSTGNGTATGGETSGGSAGGTVAPAPLPSFGGTGEILTPADPEEQEALARLASAPPAPDVVAGRPLALGEGAQLAAAAGGELPPSLVLVLALLAAGAVLAALPYARRRVAARRSPA